MSNTINFNKAHYDENDPSILHIDEEIFVMTEEETTDKSPEEVLKEYQKAGTEQALADAYCLAHNKFWFIEDDIYDYEGGTEEYSKAKTRIDSWFDLMRSLEKKIFDILISEGVSIPQKATIEAMLPFMNRNGYEFLDGWWYPESED